MCTKFGLFILFLTSILSWRPSKGPTATLFTSTPGLDTIAIRKVLRAVNALRARGCRCPDGSWFAPAPTLQVDERLNAAAQVHAEDMQRRNYFKHTTPEGRTPAHRVSQAGYSWAQVGENIAWGQPTPESVVESWRNSSGHCANMMNPAFLHMGIGRAGTYWVQVLAAPSSLLRRRP
ncbi:MAG: CAP domain-containing protein [Saprospiraceae bacterium]|nr:CAP domain-containing protein [Saprospiraceae bacterium]MDW8483725.1 CAP domain-containing protein [Saprospiraceae bacterium]